MLITDISLWYAAAFGPLFLGPLSEIHGRSRVLQVANMWYFGMYRLMLVITLGLFTYSNHLFDPCLFYAAWNLGCGFAQNKGQLIAFRFLAGLGGSAPLSVRIYHFHV